MCRRKMEYFSVGQKWSGTFGVFGTFFGEVIEVSEEGRCGVVVITDLCGNEMDTYVGGAAEFQFSGEWQLADHIPPLRCVEAN